MDTCRPPYGVYVKEQYLYMTKTKVKSKKNAIVALARKLAQFMFAIQYCHKDILIRIITICA